MRTQRLLWIALGCMLTTIVWILVQETSRTMTVSHATTDYLILEEPVNEVNTELGFDSEMIAFETGALLRDCGAWYFETTFLYPDHTPTADLPLISENLGSIECVILEAGERGISIKTDTRWKLDIGEIILSARAPFMAEE